MTNGLITLPWWGYIIITLILTHITIASVTIYLHRNQAHRALDLHPLLSHFFRFWLWLTTGMGTKEWVAVHRKHHAKVESEGDPHSPQVKGIRKVFWQGTELYRAEAACQETLEQYGHETPSDWLERNLYNRFSTLGIGIMLLVDLLLFGPIGLTIWAVQMIWIPLFAAGVINGIGHWWGYRNFDSPDAATNIIPLGILIGGEEMHNNHHAFASSAKFSNKWWEFDIGWLYIRLFQGLRLARVKKVAPTPRILASKRQIDLDTLSAVISNRLHIMSQYTKQVVGRVYKEERLKVEPTRKKVLKKIKPLIFMPQFSMDKKAQLRLEELLRENNTLKIVYDYKQQLLSLWQEKTATSEALMHNLQEWCRQAEATGIEALEEFARTLKGYSMQPA